mgnify:CR=1 FL=1
MELSTLIKLTFSYLSGSNQMWSYRTGIKLKKTRYESMIKNLLIVFVLGFILPLNAQMYDITVDGDPSDWESNDGSYSGTSLSIHNSGIFNGQWIYKGESGDQRTDSGDPDSNFDLTEIRVGASSTTLYFLIRFDNITNVGLPIVSLAFSASGSPGGFNYIGDGAETGTSGGSHLDNNASNVIDIHAPNDDGADPEFNTGSGFSNRGAAVISTANNCIEFGIAFSDLNGSISNMSTLLLSVIVGQDNNTFANSGDAFAEFFQSDALDGLTPGASSGNFFGRSGGIGTGDFDVESTSIQLTNANLLPVEFANISARTTEESIRLTFSTQTEINNSHFDIQRSTDSRQWQSLGSIAGAGTTLEQQDYRFLDKAPVLGINYYRIKQIDFDGTSSYSLIVSANWSSKPTITLYPNPTSDQVQIRGLSITEEEVMVEILDLTGKVLLRQVGNQTPIDLQTIPKGTYILQLLTNKRLLTQERIIVQ